MKPIYGQNRQTLSYQEIQDRIVREGYAAGFIYAFCDDGMAYIGRRQNGNELFSPTDKEQLEAIVGFSDFLLERVPISAMYVVQMRKEKKGFFERQ
jgi:hypothetical protein